MSETYPMYTADDIKPWPLCGGRAGVWLTDGVPDFVSCLDERKCGIEMRGVDSVEHWNALPHKEGAPENKNGAR